jgi:hypothetical protein
MPPVAPAVPQKVPSRGRCEQTPSGRCKCGKSIAPAAKRWTGRHESRQPFALAAAERSKRGRCECRRHLAEDAGV